MPGLDNLYSNFQSRSPSYLVKTIQEPEVRIQRLTDFYNSNRTDQLRCLVPDRFVSLGSFLIVAFSVIVFGMSAWWTLVGKIGEGDGLLLFAGSVMAAIVFSYRGFDPHWLEPLSIVKK